MKRGKAYTLAELLVVIAIIAIIAAILFPVLARAKAAARQSKCISNLRQIGGAFGLYMNDYDDRWPLGLDPADRYTPQIWREYPDFQRRIPELPLMHDLLIPYLPSKQIWECPADKGQIVDDVSWEILETFPSSYDKYGSSYYYRTELTVRQLTGNLSDISDINVYFDGSGAWHSGADILRPEDTPEQRRQKLQRYRYNVLFGDFHSKNISRAQYEAAWAMPL